MDDVIGYGTLKEAYIELGKLPAKNTYYIYKNAMHKYYISKYKKDIIEPILIIHKIESYDDFHNLGVRLLRKEKIEKINKNHNNE